MKCRQRKIITLSGYSNQILCISGASGSGKTTTCALLSMLYPNRYMHILFDRNRISRPGEFGSRQMSLDSMLQKYHNGEYFNLAVVTNNGYAAIRTDDVNKAFSCGKAAVMEFPLERVCDLEKTFKNANITIIELVAPSENERRRRLKRDNKYTEQRIESPEWGKGRIIQYKDGKLLTLHDHNLVLITERGRLVDTAKNINKFMQLQELTISQLAVIEKLGIEAVKKIISYFYVENYLCIENIDKELIELFMLR